MGNIKVGNIFMEQKTNKEVLEKKCNNANFTETHILIDNSLFRS